MFLKFYNKIKIYALSLCPRCGTPIYEEDEKCPICGYDPKTSKFIYRRYKDNPFSHLGNALKLFILEPPLMAPTVFSGIIMAAIMGITIINTENNFINYLLMAIGYFQLHLFNIMGKNTYINKPQNLRKSLRYTIEQRHYIYTTIISGILSLTIFLIPIISLILVIIVYDETTPIKATKKSITLLKENYTDILSIILFSIVGTLLFKNIPIIGGIFLSTIFMITSLAFLDSHIYKYPEKHENLSP